MTSYAEIFSKCLNKIDDPSLAQWPEEDLSNELYGWLESAIAKIPQIRSEVAERDVFDPAHTDTLGFKNDLSDVTKEVLALGMRRAWLSPQIASTTVTWQRFSKKEGYSDACMREKEYSTITGFPVLSGASSEFCIDSLIREEYGDLSK